MEAEQDLLIHGKFNKANFQVIKNWLLQNKDKTPINRPDFEDLQQFDKAKDLPTMLCRSYVNNARPLLLLTEE